MTKLITILGPTASGKTILAALVASALGAEVISADSRQVFSGMNIGTGKDLDDYIVGNSRIPVHLVNIAEPGTEFSVYNFVAGFYAAFAEILKNKKPVILCGGTGLYIEAVLKGYNMVEVPVNMQLRDEWRNFNNAKLEEILRTFKPLHNTTDTVTRDRLMRALEIEYFKQENPQMRNAYNFSGLPVFGLKFERQTERTRITQRLHSRLNEGMVEEVRQLLELGIPAQRLMQYGLEYKYVTQYITGELQYKTMTTQLNTAIHQFAKRQMTWFRRMERNGIQINWLRGEDGLNKNVETILQCTD
jgi:tRNA dimethylallyltransferase